MDGVSTISVDYDKKSGDLEFDEAKVKKEDIFKGIAELGYTAKE
jgi:copper chaperone CopZ